jgi:glycosyltransferase involved in cell wall biosynthesis
VKPAQPPTVVFLVTTDWFFWSHRLPIARAARKAGFHVVVATRVKSHGEAIRGEGFEVIPITIPRAFGSPWAEFRSLLGIVGLYRRVRPALVHHISVKCALYGTISARFARVPAVVNTLPGLGYLFNSGRWQARVVRPLVCHAFRFLFRGKATRVIVQNSDDRDFLEDEGLVTRDRLVLVRGSGVDVSRFTPRPEPDGPPTVVMVSRMLWDKGVGELVEAARLLRSWGRQVRVVLIGNPDPENPGSIPAEQLAEWNESGCIEWSGPRGDIPAVWASAHVAALPSYYGEGVPKALIEAAACGRPIVAADTPGCREIVRQGVNGLLVPPRDAAALAAALDQLVSDPALRQRMGARGRQIAEYEFADDIVVANTLAVYRDVLEACRE